MTPIREKTQSNVPGRSMTWTSPAMNRTFSTPGSGGLRDRGLDEGFRDVHSKCLALGPDHSRQPSGGVAEAAADVEHTTLPVGRVKAKRLVAELANPVTMSSRKLTNRSKRTPLHASVASSFSVATG
jgi:hypothetical protein